METRCNFISRVNGQVVRFAYLGAELRGLACRRRNRERLQLLADRLLVLWAALDAPAGTAQQNAAVDEPGLFAGSATLQASFQRVHGFDDDRRSGKSQWFRVVSMG